MTTECGAGKPVGGVRRRALQMFGVVALATVAMIGARAANGDTASGIRAVLQSRFPQIEIENVRASQWPGLYEVLTPSEIVYANATGDYLFVGKMIDTKSREDLTARSWNESQTVDFDALPFDKSIRIVKGDGSRRLAIFEDPECPYCERLEHELESVNDVTIDIFLYPLTELHPDAEKIARGIWCAEDRAAAWSAWMVRKIAPQPAIECASDPIAEVRSLAEKLKVNVTPTVFFANGKRNAGLLNAEQLEQALGQRVAARK